MSKLQEIYIKKYVSSKDYGIVLKTATRNFDEIRLNQDYSIINKELDLILYIMSKSEFLGLIRHSIILYNSLNDEKVMFDEKHKLLSKKEIIDNYCTRITNFILYLTASLYSYV